MNAMSEDNVRSDYPKRIQVIDVALYESVLNLMEGTISEFDLAGVKREREGMRLTGIVPSGTYACADGVYIVIGANGDSMTTRASSASRMTTSV